MNVTRDVMNDLLPAYFSGEASADTRTLVEEYFRDNPEFERIARGSARSLEMLQTAVAVAPEAKKEKRDLECVRGDLRRRKVLFGVALFMTLFPLAFFSSNGHLHWLLREDPKEAAVLWCLAAVLWLAHFRRVRRRTASLFIAIIFVVAPLLLDSRLIAVGGWRAHGKGDFDLLWEAAVLGGFAILLFIQYFAGLRRRTAMLMFAIYATIIPIPIVWYLVRVGGPHLASKVAGPAVLWLVAAWVWWGYFRLRRKPKSAEDSDSDCF